MNYQKKILTWEEFYLNISSIASQIVKDDIKVDVLVPVVKGGFIPSVFLGKHLNIDNYSCIQVRRSKSNLANCDFEDAKFLGLLNSEIIANSNILIVEDIIYSGETLELVLKELKKYNPKNIYICSMFNFYTGDKFGKIYYGNKNPSDVNWIVFPWDYEHPYK